MHRAGRELSGSRCQEGVEFFSGMGARSIFTPVSDDLAFHLLATEGHHLPPPDADRHVAQPAVLVHAFDAALTGEPLPELLDLPRLRDLVERQPSKRQAIGRVRFNRRRPGALAGRLKHIDRETVHPVGGGCSNRHRVRIAD